MHNARSLVEGESPGNHLYRDTEKHTHRIAEDHQVLGGYCSSQERLSDTHLSNARWVSDSLC